MKAKWIAGPILALMALWIGMQLVWADHTPPPSAVVMAGSFQDELGCPGDWQPDCANTALAYDATDDVWQNVFNVPAGSWEYKAALNNSWDENYGANAQQNGPNIGLTLAGDQAVKFYYDHKSHWVTDNVNSVIATAPGSYQDEIGCPGDWQPDCLRSWLQDPDGDGIYRFVTEAIPPGSYEVKVAIDERWDENYGQGGAPNGPNIPFSVPVNGVVEFIYDAATHVLTVNVTGGGHGPDNNVEYSGLGHNSQDTLYRTPFGAITPGTELILRFRTYHNDVTGVKVRFWDDVERREFFQEMEPAARDVSCYDPGQPDETCDFWETRVAPDQLTTLYYRFIVRDGTAVAYYDDDRFQDGGWGEATPNLEDDSYAVTVYDPDFQPVEWLQNGVVYQIFPDRFRNGRRNNDPSPSEPRYGYPDDPLDQIVRKAWGDLPEGYCRSYVNPAQPCTEQPRGRDYFGGDLRGVQQRLNYLKDLGVTAIYFNPLFESASNHGYDTQDYYSIDHFFGSNREWRRFVRKARRRGIRVILDGVFNHVSSDSPYFDRYHHFDEVGACESVDSPYRDWFFFQDVPPGTGACVGSDGTPDAANYSAWFGFDSLPVLNKDNPDVRALVYGDEDAVARHWLEAGAAGWRLDVMGDPSFPEDFWPAFREAVKQTKEDAVVIGELWKKHETLVKVRGDQADTAMNYRFRNAILGFFGRVDDKGFPDDGASNQPPSLFARKLLSIREDYPDATYYTLLNLLDSHDTERILWSLTPGQENREEKEFNPANLERGKQMLRLATVVQMTSPGAPTIYYGDEVGVTGDDDPDDRRTMPWGGPGRYGLGGDRELLAHYKLLTRLRRRFPVFREGELRFLVADDTERTLAYLMRTRDQAAIVAINPNDTERTLAMDIRGELPGDLALVDALGGLGTVTASDGILSVTLPGLRAAVLLPIPGQDLEAPAPPAQFTATAQGVDVQLSWAPVADASAYRVYRSPLHGGGYVLVVEVNDTSFLDTSLPSGKPVYYVVTAVDASGIESDFSSEAETLPAYIIGWANLQWPPSMEHTISALNPTPDVYGQVWIDGVTSQPGPTEGLWAQLGWGADGSDPATDPSWQWVDAAFNVDAGNNDEFVANLLPDRTGTFDYAYRYSTDGGRSWLYADLDGTGNGYSPDQAGSLTVHPSDDTTPPPPPANLRATFASNDAVQLAWDPVTGDPTFYQYEVLRSQQSGGPYTLLGQTTDTAYTDLAVTEGETYFYVVRSVDTSFNRSGFSNEVAVTAQRRTVQVTFRVTVPDTTPPDATVYIAGTLDRLDGNLPQWDPAGVALTPVGNRVWEVTLSGQEGTNIEYKYTLGSWDFVEKGANCEELANRQLTLDYGVDGHQLVEDTVLNWRNIAPCGP